MKRRVVATREVSYPFRKEVHPFHRHRKVELRDDPGGLGWEVVSEKKVCLDC